MDKLVLNVYSVFEDIQRNSPYEFGSTAEPQNASINYTIDVSEDAGDGVEANAVDDVVIE